MFVHDSCQSAVQSCLGTGTFAVARLYGNEENTDIQIHGCYEVYFSVSGKKQFMIDNRVYVLSPDDIFFISPFEGYSCSCVDGEMNEWVTLFIDPRYLGQLSTLQTDLRQCFVRPSVREKCVAGVAHKHGTGDGDGQDTVIGRRLSLSGEERRRFMYFVHRFSEQGEFGQDVLDQAVFMELMTFLNQVCLSRRTQEQSEACDYVQTTQTTREIHHAEVDEVLSYINQHLAEELSISILASCFYLSSSYLCKIFKDITGTTINRYITARRISQAKVLLAEGHSVADTSDLCGFGDYSNFLKSFTKIVGISPKKYASCARK